MLGYSPFLLIVPFAIAMVMPGWRSLILLALPGGGLSVCFNDISKDGGLGGAIGFLIVWGFTLGLASGVVIRVVILARGEPR